VLQKRPPASSRIVRLDAVPLFTFDVACRTNDERLKKKKRGG
jgi:hypothetical protein